MNNKEAIEALNLVRSDLTMLKYGDWTPDMHSCQDTLDSVEKVINHLEKSGDDGDGLSAGYILGVDREGKDKS